MIGVKDINNKDIPNNGRYNIHPTPESLLNCYREYAQRNGDPFIWWPSWYKKAPIFLPMNNKDNEIENENGRDVTPSTKTLRAYG